MKKTFLSTLAAVFVLCATIGFQVANAKEICDHIDYIELIKRDGKISEDLSDVEYQMEILKSVEVIRHIDDDFDKFLGSELEGEIWGTRNEFVLISHEYRIEVKNDDDNIVVRVFSGDIGSEIVL